jgi:RimJ/RimL family protein N-acetyltransferase
MIMLVVATEAHFAWLAGEAPAPAGLTHPHGGVEPADVIGMVRSMVAALHAKGCLACWLMAEDGMVVGICSFKAPPDEMGCAEIGYGVAPEHRSKGHATAAVGLMCAEVFRSGIALRLVAETAIDNVASQRVLERNGFAPVGSRYDADDGDLIIWSTPGA